MSAEVFVNSFKLIKKCSIFIRFSFDARASHAPGRILGALCLRVASRRSAETALAVHILELIRKRSTTRSLLSKCATIFLHNFNFAHLRNFFLRFLGAALRLVISSLDGETVVMRPPGILKVQVFLVFRRM